jgi:hypothetical protein
MRAPSAAEGELDGKPITVTVDMVDRHDRPPGLPYGAADRMDALAMAALIAAPAGLRPP